MNVTEKQKQILINFMRSHPDFGRGRLRYNRENKKKLDELWDKVTETLNSTGCGPQKLPKEWAKTWRDWKSNLLKRIATYKSYAGSTGGGPPKILDLNPSEEDLLEFLTPDASGMFGIPEGGAIGDSPSQEDYSILTKLPSRKSFVSHGRPNSSSSTQPLAEKTSISEQNLQTTSSWQRIKKSLQGSQTSSQRVQDFSRKVSFEKHSLDSEMITPSSSRLSVSSLTDSRYSKSSSYILNDEEDIEDTYIEDFQDMEDRENVPKVQDKENVHEVVENVQDTENAHCNKSTQNKRFSDIEDFSDTNKKRKRTNVKSLFEQHTSDYNNIQEQMLQIKKDKLTLAREQFEFKKKVNDKQIELLTALVEKVDNLTNTVQSITPQYLEL